MEILVVLIGGLLIAGPIIAIVAYIRVQDLTAKLNSIGLQESVRRMPHPQTVAPDHLENLIGGHWLNRIGILAVFIGISFFLKYAFDNNWIGPSGRVAIGILLGALMLPWSHWLLSRGYPYFSEGIAALGQAILLLSLWAGCRYYAVFSREVGFAGMVLVTITIAAVALGRDSQRIAMLSMLGGFLTPLLVSTGRDEQIALLTYIFILSEVCLRQ